MSSFSKSHRDCGGTHRVVALLLLLLLFTFSTIIVPVQGYACIDKHCECISVSGKLTASCSPTSGLAMSRLPPCSQANRVERERLADIQALNLTNSLNLDTLAAKFFANACLHNLQKIWMSHVGLNHVDDEAFAELSIVVDLSLSHNSLSLVPTRAVAHLARLRTLDLSHNHIKMIVSNAFISNSALETLTLNNNDILEIEPSAFYNLDNLKILNLAANRLKRLHSDVIGYVPSLHTLYLEDNEWICDCLMQPFKRRLLLRRSLNLHDQPRCKTSGADWSNLALDNFQCLPQISRNFSDTEVTTSEGSTLRLKCAVMVDTFGDQAADEEYLSYTQMSWFWNDILITNNSKGCDDTCKGFASDGKGSSQHFEVHEAIREFSIGVKLKISTLTLHSIMTINEGRYRCEASNTAGQAENIYKVHVITYGNSNAGGIGSNRLDASSGHIHPEASRSSVSVFRKASMGDTSEGGSDHILFGLVLGIFSGIFIVLVIFSIVLVVFFRRDKAHPKAEPSPDMIHHQEMTLVGDSNSSTIDDNHETATEKLNVSQIEFNPLLTQVNPVAKPPRLGIPDVSSIYSSPAWTMDRANRSRYASYAETEPLYSDYYTLYRNRPLNSRLENRTFISDTASEV